MGESGNHLLHKLYFLWKGNRVNFYVKIISFHYFSKSTLLKPLEFAEVKNILDKIICISQITGLSFTYYSHYQPKLAKIRADHPFIVKIVGEVRIRNALPFFGQDATFEENIDGVLFAARVKLPNKTLMPNYNAGHMRYVFQ